MSGVSCVIMTTNTSDGIYHRLWRRLYIEVVGSYSIPRSTLVAESTRLDCYWREHGMTFYTSFLAELGKAFDKCFATGEPVEWPSFLGGQPLFEWLFDRFLGPDGRVSFPADARAVSHMRQLTLIMYKLELPYKPELVQLVVDQWSKDEQDMEAINSDVDALMNWDSPIYLRSCDSKEWLRRRVITRARSLITKVLGNVDPRDIKPSHGPGVVATGERVHEKTYLRRSYVEVEAVYPFWEYMSLNLTSVADEYQERPVILGCGPTSKVVFVPKDSRGPRLISCEPLELMWLQQGLKDRLYQAIENHPLTRGRVNFADQDVNREFALRASRGEPWVTLDLKNASDRVSLEVVKTLFQGTRLLEGLLALRSTWTRFGNDDPVWLHKFAPMGSALCFPVEAIVFWAIIVACVSVHRCKRLAESAANCFVYGDDIVVSRENYNLARSALESIGLIVNESKCCVSGFFAESCGCDAFMGIDVTPVRFRTTWSSRGNPSHVASWVEYSNRLYERGYTQTALAIEQMVREVGYEIPYLAVEDFGVKSRYAFAYYRPRAIAAYLNEKHGIKRRYSRQLHAMFLRGYALRPLTISDKRPDSWSRVLRELLCRDGMKVSGKNGVPVTGTYALTRRVRLKRVWMPAGNMPVGG